MFSLKTDPKNSAIELGMKKEKVFRVKRALRKEVGEKGKRVCLWWKRSKKAGRFEDSSKVVLRQPDYSIAAVLQTSALCK
jgi:hypothetical protein